MGKLVDDDPPLTARQVLHMPAGAYPQAAPSTGVGVTDGRGRRDQLTAARKVRAGEDLHHLVEGGVRVLDEQAGRFGHFGQIVRNNFV